MNAVSHFRHQRFREALCHVPIVVVLGDRRDVKPRVSAASSYAPLLSTVQFMNWKLLSVP